MTGLSEKSIESIYCGVYNIAAVPGKVKARIWLLSGKREK
jgi:translation initiation factor IF-1